MPGAEILWTNSVVVSINRVDLKSVQENVCAIFLHALVRTEVCGETLVNSSNSIFMKQNCIFITKRSSLSQKQQCTQGIFLGGINWVRI